MAMGFFFFLPPLVSISDTGVLVFHSMYLGGHAFFLSLDGMDFVIGCKN